MNDEINKSNHLLSNNEIVSTCRWVCCYCIATYLRLLPPTNRSVESEISAIVSKYLSSSGLKNG